MIVSIDAEKGFDKIQHSSMKKKKKPLQKVGIEGTYLNTIEAIYDRATASSLETLSRPLSEAVIVLISFYSILQ